MQGPAKPQWETWPPKNLILCNLLPANEGVYRIPIVPVIFTPPLSRDIFAEFWVELVLWGILCLSLVETNLDSQI